MSSTPCKGDNVPAVVEHFGSRLFLVFSYFFFTVEFKKERNFLNEPAMTCRTLWILPTIHDACLSATLMAIRDLDDFLSARPLSHADDLKAFDLGLKEDLGFLGKSERECINKRIMHSTKIAASGNQEIKWDIGELTTKCISQSLYFLRWLEVNLPPEIHANTLEMANAVVGYRTQIEKILDYARKVKAANVWVVS